MIPKPFEQITFADIQQLVTNADEERQRLEFKATLPGGSEKDLVEFRADVSSFANTAGGDLIFGIDAPKGTAISVLGLPKLQKDADMLRLTQSLRAGVEPRIEDYEIRTVDIPGKSPVMLLRINRSWQAPHAVRTGESYRVFARDHNGKYSMNWTQIGAAVTRADELLQRMRSWRDERIAAFLDGRPPLPLLAGPVLLLHIFPINGFATRQQVSAAKLKGQMSHFAPLGETSLRHRLNLDGLLTFAGASHDKPFAYTQAFRNGVIEGATTYFVDPERKPPLIGTQWLIENISSSVNEYRIGLLNCGFTLPFAVFGTVIDARGVVLAISPRHHLNANHPIDRKLLDLPDIRIDSNTSDPKTDLRPMFDGLWNACGWIECPAFDAQGKYVGLQ